MSPAMVESRLAGAPRGTVDARERVVPERVRSVLTLMVPPLRPRLTIAAGSADPCGGAGAKDISANLPISRLKSVCRPF